MFDNFALILAVAATLVAAKPPPKSTCSPIGISPSSASAVGASFTSAGIVPTYLPSIIPKVALNVTYDKPVNLGNTFSVTETLQSPTFSFSAESDYDPSTTKYLFLITDYDAPSPDNPVLHFFLHEIIYNAQPSCIKTQTPIIFVPYASLTPLSVQSHRYTYLLYRQPPNFVPPFQIGEVTRAFFDLPAFVVAGNLTLVGGNFMFEGLDTTVPEVAAAVSSFEAALATNSALTPAQQSYVSAAGAALATLGL